MKLYDSSVAPSPRRARIFLAEKGLVAGQDFENIQIDLRSGEQMGEAFRAINPRCAVPALQTDACEVLSENIAIASYIEAMHPEPQLMGSSPIERAQILEWNWRCEFEGLAAVAEILRNSSPHMKGRAMTGPRNIEQLPELAERGRLRLSYFYEDLNEQLKTRDFICGDSYSFADITAQVMVDFSGWVKASPDESLTAIHDWHKRVSARPSAKA